MKRALVASPLLLAAAALSLTACSSPAHGAAASDDAAGPISVVASTNVWGDIAATIGGDAVKVTSIIDDPERDPHEYEADAQAQLALSKATVVIENGGGYDDFIDTMLDAADNDDAVVLNAVDISGKKAPAEGELNEHVWYDFPTVQKVVDKVEAALSKADPDKADTFSANADELSSDIDGLIAKEAELKAAHAGAGAAITEPVPLYVLEAMGLENKTPDEFSESIEEDSDVSPSVLQETLALFSDHAVKVLAYNEQTTGPQTEAVLDAAKQNGVAVVPVTETLPDGDTYVSWMNDTLEALSTALSA